MIALYWFTPFHLVFRLSPRQHSPYYLFQKIRNKINSVETVSEVIQEPNVKVVTKIKKGDQKVKRSNKKHNKTTPELHSKEMSKPKKSLSVPVKKSSTIQQIKP